MKKTIGLLMILTSLMVGWNVFAETETVDGVEWNYQIVNGGAEVGIDGGPATSTSIIGEIAIPSALGGCPVTRIGSNAFWRSYYLESVTIPGSVTNIGGAAFMDCCNLANVMIPSGVISIGGSAFSGCCNLTSVTIPDSVTDIGGSAFSRCTGLTSVTIPNGVTRIECGTFEVCSGLTSIVIPHSVTIIEDHAFNYCRSLTSVTIPNSVTQIGKYAFFGGNNWRDDGPTSVTIPDSVTKIGQFAFSGKCIDIDTIPGAMLVDGWIIGPSWSSNIIEIKGVRGVADQAFSNSGYVESVRISNVPHFGDEVFSACGNLANVTIDNGVTNIGYAAFQNCSSLLSVTIGNGLTSIKSKTFCECSKLTGINIPDSVTSIGHKAFSRCIGLTSLTIPASVTKIDGYAFEYCTDLRSIYFRGNKPYLNGNTAFLGISSDCVVYVDKDSAGWWGVSIPGTWILSDISNKFRIEYWNGGAIFDRNDIEKTFGSDSEVAKNIKTDEELGAFNEFVSSCGVSSAVDMTEGQKGNAWKSFKFAESGVVAVPQLFEEDTKLRVDEFNPAEGNWSMTISLKVGDEAIMMAKNAMAERIAIGTSLDNMKAATADDIVARPETNSTSLTFTIKPPSINQGFMKIKID